VAPGSWIAASGALPRALDPDAPGARDFLARLATAYDRYLDRVRTERWDDGPPVPCSERKTEHPRVGLYGALNWGDWQFPGYRDHVRGCDGWGTSSTTCRRCWRSRTPRPGAASFWTGSCPRRATTATSTSSTTPPALPT